MERTSRAIRSATERKVVPKNLVVYFLDTLSQSLFWQYQADMPALWRMKNESMYFTNCYAAGCSTIFAMRSLAQGSIAMLDPITAYTSNDPVFKSFEFGKSVFEILRDDFGYQLMLLNETGSYIRTEKTYAAKMDFFALQRPEFDDVISDMPMEHGAGEMLEKS